MDFAIQIALEAVLASRAAHRCWREVTRVSIETKTDFKEVCLASHEAVSGLQMAFLVLSKTYFSTVVRGDLITEIFLCLRTFGGLLLLPERT